jgi:3-deoxy-manno-octulosonate cytidylyltransferase (CMP-KDO synthetase)
VENSAIVIPVRMGSTRFPGKPLARILGQPMLEWVVRHSIEAIGQDRTIVATCDAEIVDLAKTLGVKSVVTSDAHERATDRTAEAVGILEGEGLLLENVLMLQGDEPTIKPDALRLALDSLGQQPPISIVNLVGPISSDEEWRDPNCIKVVRTNSNKAVYFSRFPIPHGGEIGKTQVLKQVCAIGFKRSALREFANLTPTALEIAESIDMLRWIENGRPIYLQEVSTRTHPVDHPHDIDVVEEILKSSSSQSYSHLPNSG